MTSIISFDFIFECFFDAYPICKYHSVRELKPLNIVFDPQKGGWRVASGQGRGSAGVATSNTGYGYKDPPRAFGDPVKDPLRSTNRSFRSGQSSYTEPQVIY